MAVYGESAYGEDSYGESGSAAAIFAAPLAIALAVGFAPTVEGDSYAYHPQLATATAVGFNPGATQQSTVVVATGIATARGFTPTLTVGILTPQLGTVVTAAFAPVVVQLISGGTDTSNVMDGRSRSGASTGTTTRPVEPVPAGLTLGERVDKAIAYPNPVMVNGRPT